MAIIRWNPWKLSSLMDEDWEMPTIPGLSRLGQGLNLYETDRNVIAEVALPGITEDNIDVTVEDGVVRITATQSDQQEDKGDRRYFMSSMSRSYNYSFRLPEGITADKEPVCELENGVLTIEFPKVEQKPPKKIQVKAKPKIEKTK